jgi:hypothetical protein
MTGIDTEFSELSSPVKSMITGWQVWLLNNRHVTTNPQRHCANNILNSAPVRPGVSEELSFMSRLQTESGALTGRSYIGMDTDSITLG